MTERQQHLYRGRVNTVNTATADTSQNADRMKTDHTGPVVNGRRYRLSMIHYNPTAVSRFDCIDAQPTLTCCRGELT